MAERDNRESYAFWRILSCIFARHPETKPEVLAELRTELAGRTGPAGELAAADDK